MADNYTLEVTAHVGAASEKAGGPRGADLGGVFSKKGPHAKQHKTLVLYRQNCVFVILLVVELELIQSHMAQKPVLRGEVGCACVAREVSVERGGMGERGCKALGCCILPYLVQLLEIRSRNQNFSYLSRALVHELTIDFAT